ncbi:MAG: hydroxymethylbilane synthase, partial [Phycisphaerae bacterium]|nr:hydroxymethylbilane synthase [Phycisphaerae bacterium]
MKSEFVIGTRGSLLARSQTELVAAALRSAFGDVAFRVVTVRTSGDAIADQALHAVGGKGLFTKELEDALADRRIDLAVHSLKDLPTQFPRGLVLGAVPTR